MHCAHGPRTPHAVAGACCGSIGARTMRRTAAHAMSACSLNRKRFNSATWPSYCFWRSRVRPLTASGSVAPIGKRSIDSVCATHLPLDKNHMRTACRTVGLHPSSTGSHCLRTITRLRTVSKNAKDETTVIGEQHKRVKEKWGANVWTISGTHSRLRHFCAPAALLSAGPLHGAITCVLSYCAAHSRQ